MSRHKRNMNTALLFLILSATYMAGVLAKKSSLQYADWYPLMEWLAKYYRENGTPTQEPTVSSTTAGTYERVQCSYEPGRAECWCVDVTTGKEEEGTRVPAYVGRAICP